MTPMHTDNFPDCRERNRAADIGKIANICAVRNGFVVNGRMFHVELVGDVRREWGD